MLFLLGVLGCYKKEAKEREKERERERERDPNKLGEKKTQPSL